MLSYLPCRSPNYDLPCVPPQSKLLKELPHLVVLEMPVLQPLPPGRFCFSIKPIKPDYGIQPPHVTLGSNPVWEPPTVHGAFTATAVAPWYYWYNGTVSEVPPQNRAHIQVHRTTSMFWCYDRQAFVHVPYDCTAVDVKDAMGGLQGNVPLPWNKITFHNKIINNRCVSLLGYGYERDELGAPGSPSWMPELLPQRYQYQGTSATLGRCQLAGDLSIILGLAAFSMSPQATAKSIGESLRRTASGTEWTPHGGQGQGSKALSHYRTTESLTLYRD